MTIEEATGILKMQALRANELKTCLVSSVIVDDKNTVEDIINMTECRLPCSIAIYLISSLADMAEKG